MQEAVKKMQEEEEAMRRAEEERIRKEEEAENARLEKVCISTTPCGGCTFDSTFEDDGRC
jgi:hypothetical protein